MTLLLALYRVVLYGCPAAVRRACARDMEAVFVHCLRTEWGRRGSAGRAGAGLRGFTDVLLFVMRTRWDGWRSPASSRRIAPGRPLVIMRDIRGTVRLLRSQPALSAAIVFMFALGIGATTAIFSVVYGVLLRPLPFPEPDRLLHV
jgi:hypothetical protein